MGSGFPAPAASDPRSSDLSEVDVVEDVAVVGRWRHLEERDQDKFGVKVQTMKTKIIWQIFGIKTNQHKLEIYGQPISRSTDL